MTTPKIEFELKVSKQDVIEMVIAEREAEIDRLIKENDKATDLAEKDRLALKKFVEEDAIKFARTEHKALYKNYPETEDPSVNWSDSHINHVKLRHTKGRSYSESVDISTRTDISPHNCTQFKNWSAYKTARAKLKTLKLEANELAIEKKGLAKKGAKAKAAIVRSMLAETPEGQRILNQVSQFALMLPERT